MLSYTDSLKILKKTKALLEGHFLLSSGLHSNKYIQCAKLLSFPNKAKKICKSLTNKINKKLSDFDIILSPAIGGIVIGYEIGRILNKETIFTERVNKKFVLRRNFNIKKGSKVLIVEDVITTGKSTLECVKLVKKFDARVIGFACIVNRSTSNYLNGKKIISQIKIKLDTFDKKKLPNKLKKIPMTQPGSRNI